MIILILLFNALRFIGLEISPSGFYADESKLLHIEFRTPNATSPVLAGISTNDGRVLGIGLRSAVFKQ